MSFPHGDTTREAARRKRKRPQLVPERKRIDSPDAAARKAAAPEPKFQLNQLADYSDESVLGEMRRVAALVPGPVLTSVRFDETARISAALCWKRFGGWRQALERAGLGHRYSGRPPANRERWRKSHGASDAELLQELQAVARAKGSDTISRADLAHAVGPGPRVLAGRFGSWEAALAAAGLKPSPSARRYTDGECFENLLRVWTHRGRKPHFIEMSRPPSTVKAPVYLRRFGSWRRALETFAAKANGEPALQAPVPVPEPPPAPAARPEDNARVPLSLRFRVLERGRFKCAACGLSPAIDPFCRLHVDHIVPVSRGGKTELGNLRTLCAYCNIGRGNRVAENAGATQADADLRQDRDKRGHDG